MTGQCASDRIIHDVERQSRARQLSCRCGNTWSVPALWSSDICELCGCEVEVDPKHLPIIYVMRETLAWAGLDWRNLDCTLGNPHDLPTSVMEQLTKQGAPQFLWLDDTFQWDCLNCAQCCSQDQIFDADEAAQLTETDASRLGITGCKLRRNDLNRACAFWRHELSCTVHAKRPTFCRIFPLGTMELQRGTTTQKYVAVMGPGCRGLGQGSLWTVRQFLAASGILHKFFDPPR